MLVHINEGTTVDAFIRGQWFGLKNCPGEKAWFWFVDAIKLCGRIDVKAASYVRFKTYSEARAFLYTLAKGGKRDAR